MQLEIPQFALLGHVQMQRIHLPWKMQCPVIRRVHFLRGEVITDEADTSSSATDYENTSSTGRKQRWSQDRESRIQKEPSNCPVGRVSKILDPLKDESIARKNQFIFCSGAPLE